MHTRYYFVVSLSLTFLNKEVLNGFKAPLFMTLFQFVIALILIKLIGISGTCVGHSHSACPPPPTSRSFSYLPSIAFFPDFTFSYETFIRTRSLGFAYVLMVSARFFRALSRLQTPPYVTLLKLKP